MQGYTFRHVTYSFMHGGDSCTQSFQRYDTRTVHRLQRGMKRFTPDVRLPPALPLHPIVAKVSGICNKFACCDHKPLQLVDFTAQKEFRA